MANNATSPKPSGSAPACNTGNTSQRKLMKMGLPDGLAPKGSPTTRA